MKYHLDFDIEFLENENPSKFVAIEGIDGSGKTTQVKRVSEILKRQNGGLFLTKNPTDEIIGKFIREILVGKVKVNPYSLQYLFCADRVFQQEEINKNLKQGNMVLSDRYFWSAVAYGAVDRGVSFLDDLDYEAQIMLTAFSILSMYYKFLVPDLTIFLRVSSSVAIKRLRDTRHIKDIYDDEKKLKNIALGYEWLIKKFPEKFVVVDGEKDVDQVTYEILDVIDKNISRSRQQL